LTAEIVAKEFEEIGIVGAVSRDELREKVVCDIEFFGFDGIATEIAPSA
jgi:hypothetical protein